MDLAFEHFARFGRDEEVLDWLGEAYHGATASPQLRGRLAELAAEPVAPALGPGRLRDG